ncbi:cytochrome c oxidase subunit I [Alkalilimnicola ehrlichii]|uniref:cytochrome-c oxidase n=1 Tax=Alkalilimnicola ehrlichii TaxID=351052 RepID=A0A3E0WGH1_9GAMM|nr:cytochrome c oxidase subunit I [Alkalilimnicola ehrlichii]RFA24793.1 cytochrome c oxidase subunit I [Alkalilimnicola ehrlichii]RFA32052.1 cytochrome c oxidase subunit I [Alkalilimnicola ehrlichii]
MIEPRSTADRLDARFSIFWSAPSGLGQLSAVNHTSIGNRFIVTGFIFFLIGGLLAMLMRTQLALPNNDFIDFQTYNELFSMHGTTMMFLFAVPILEGFALYLVPKMIGARDLIFPRLSAFGYWCYLFGGVLLYSSFFFGQVPDSGWFMYTPLSSREFTPGKGSDFWLLGVTFVEISAVTAAIELIASILRTRAPGMTIVRMPLFVWAMLVVSFMIVFAFPPLILGSILLEIERAFDLPFYAPERGGDPLLWQHLFWLFGHPEVYIVFLPATGFLSMLIPALCGRPIVGYTWIVMALIATGFISFGLWVHHMYATGIPHLALSFFSAASLAVVIPTSIQIFAWIATLWLGKPRLNVPMLFVIGFFVNFIIGGLTGIMIALVPFDWQVHDTHFIVAHLHYVLIGGMLFPLLAAFYYWLPHFSGRMHSESIGRLVFWLMFLGFNLTFLIMHFTGMQGMPRRVYTYTDGLGWDWPNLVSSVGGFVMSAAVGLLVVDLLLHFFYGRRAPRDPWKAGSLEWVTRLPPQPYNFISIPEIKGRDPLWVQPNLVEHTENGGGYLADPASGRRETLGTSVLQARPEEVIHLPTNTFLPLVSASFVAMFFVGFLFELYSVAAAGALLALASGFFWAWRSGDLQDPGEVDAGHGLHLPMHHRNPTGPGWWGTLIALFSNGALYASLLFGYYFLWTAVPDWPPSAYVIHDLRLPTLGLVSLLASSVCVRWAISRLQHAKLPQFRAGIVAAVLLAGGFLVAEFLAMRAYAVPAEAHAYSALLHIIVGYQFVHVGVAILAAVFVLVRVHFGYVGPQRQLGARVMSLFWHYTVLAWVLGYTTVHLSALTL